MLQLVANFCFDYLKVETIPKRNQFRKGKNRMRVNLETTRKIVYSYELELRLSIYSKIFNFSYLNLFFFWKYIKRRNLVTFQKKCKVYWLYLLFSSYCLLCGWKVQRILKVNPVGDQMFRLRKMLNLLRT